MYGKWACILEFSTMQKNLTLTNFEVRQNSEYSGISTTHTKWDIKYGSSL